MSPAIAIGSRKGSNTAIILSKISSEKALASVIFAKSDFSEHPDWFDMPLPGTNTEKDSLLSARVLPNVKVYSDVDPLSPAPSEHNAKSVLKEYDLVHFATHGKLDNASPLESRIVLSADKADDGNLTVREILNIDLEAYLVTLSACETGRLKGYGDKDQHNVGDELTGLTRAFIYAGTPSVVASLWKVHDLSTALLMVQFYKNLKDSDKTRALCDAQRWFINNDRLYYFQEPFFWAPFVVFGDWQ